MRDKYRHGDVLRIVNRDRQKVPCHGDICKVLAVKMDGTIEVRIMRQANGGMENVGNTYIIRPAETERLDKDAQVALIDNLIQNENVRIEECRQTVGILQKRKEWLMTYGSEEAVLVGLCLDVLKDSSLSREEATAKVAEVIKGKLVLI